jgi:Stress responsive A/B Barrel Domain.
MVRHIVMWNLKDGFTTDENILNANRVKESLEALTATIDGIISFEVIISPLNSSNRDIVLNSLFSDEQALANYQTHPDHVRVSNYVGTVMMNRSCIDYFE